MSVSLVKSVLPRELLAACHAQTDTAYGGVVPGSGPPARLAKNLAPGEKFVPTASSFTIGAVLTKPDLQTVLTAISSSEAGAWLTHQLGEPLVCTLDHSWIRRQYSPANYPPLHAPHGWHQDGALAFDFLSFPDGNYPPDALLPMATCWIALAPCGIEAPGLELVTERLPQLLPPPELNDARIRQRFPEDRFWRPSLQPGDALLFRGDILHRTHVTPAMTRDRTSIELRFFTAVPPRLEGDHFLPLSA